jgi:glycosyltransferase involved in cell wall biosynthesis
MHIALVVYGSLQCITGGNLYDRILVSHLRTFGDQVQVISLPEHGYPGRLLDNLTVRLPHNLDVVLEDELTHLSLLAANALKLDYPVVSIVHNLHAATPGPSWRNRMYRQLERQYLRSVDGFIFNSRATCESVCTGMQVRKPFLIAAPGGDRLGSARPSEIRRRATRAGPLRVLFLANVIPLKGLHVLLEALKQFAAADIELDVVGSCEVAPSYARQMRERARGLAVQVTYHGILDGAPLIDVLRRAHVMVIPSYHEGFGMAYLEGMAFGLPSIGSEAGAIPELIQNGVNGYLISPGESQGIALRLRELASNRSLLANMGESALENFHARPTWIRSAEAVRQFLAETAGIATS